jgi:hypothetical protein
MDDLDRLYDRLATNVRDGFPHLLDRAFQLGDVGEHLVPYRLNRRELGFDSVRLYELALMRLASGERGLLRADAGVQDAFRRALATPEPDAGLLRDHARATVSLGQPGSTTQRASAPVADMPSATGIFSTPPSATLPPSGLPPASAVFDAPAGTPSPTATQPFIPAPAPADPPPAGTTPDIFGVTPSTFGIATPAWAEPPVAAPEPAAPEPGTAGAAAPQTGRPRSDRDVPLEPRPGPTVIGGPCRYCGRALPEGRPVTFCPHCGQNVTVQQCPACSTELEIGWHFCITCGRAMDETALAGPPR